ncbi:MAG: DUF4190 domain-containing protein [Actinomycetia bacterium]|nr:DUF4190 domain-containing protein [Actinomycetes bacterium]
MTGSFDPFSGSDSSNPDNPDNPRPPHPPQDLAPADPPQDLAPAPPGNHFTPPPPPPRGYTNELPPGFAERPQVPGEPVWQGQLTGAAGPYYIKPGGNAGAALAVAIIGLVLCQFLAPVAIVMGKRARDQIDRGRGNPSQRGTATAAFVIGIIGTVILCLAILFLITAGSSRS